MVKCRYQSVFIHGNGIVAMHRLRHQMEQCHVLFFYRPCCLFCASHFNLSSSVHVMKVAMPWESYSSKISYQQYAQITACAITTHQFSLWYWWNACPLLHCDTDLFKICIFDRDMFCLSLWSLCQYLHSLSRSKSMGELIYVYVFCSFHISSLSRWKISQVDKYCKSTKHNISKMYWHAIEMCMACNIAMEWFE